MIRPKPSIPTGEHERLENDRLGLEDWKKWGPHIAEHGVEGGLMGLTERSGRLCLAITLWNGHDSTLREDSLNGDDPEETLFYLQSTPTHSYMKALYKFPQREHLPRSKSHQRYADENRLWDVGVEYGKFGPDDILIRITAHNRGPETARFHLLPTLWFRNTGADQTMAERPSIQLESTNILIADHAELGRHRLYFAGDADVLFCANETNGINSYVVDGRSDAVNWTNGSRSAIWYELECEPGKAKSVRLRLTNAAPKHPFFNFDAIFVWRELECDRYYDSIAPDGLSEDQRLKQRQAFASMLWNKRLDQFNALLGPISGGGPISST